MKIILSSIVLFFSILSQGQKAPKWVQKMDKNLQPESLFFGVEMIPTDSVFWSILPYDFYRKAGIGEISGYAIEYRDDDIQVLVLDTKPENELGFSSQYPGFNIFFQNDEVILVRKAYNNNSRMGSCGNVFIAQQAYFQKNQIQYTKTIETPFECYTDPIDTTSMQYMADVFLQLKKVIPFRQFQIEMERYRDEIGWTDQSYYTEPFNLKNYELKWVIPFAQDPIRPEKPYEQTFTVNPYQKIGNRYLIVRISDSEPTGMVRYTLYYYEKKEGAN
jgi:hypothetical protein